MTPGRRRLAALVGILVGIALVVAAVLLWRSGIETSSYPPVELPRAIEHGFRADADLRRTNWRPVLRSASK